MSNSYQFETDENGNILAALPVGAYSETISPAVACTAPIVQTDIAQPGKPFDRALLFPAPIIGGEGDDNPDAGDGGAQDGGSQGGAIPSIDISGQIRFFFQDAGVPNGTPIRDAGLPIGATVRILAAADAGVIAGSRLSGDQPLQFINGSLWFGSSFIPGGPAALPVAGPPAPGVIRNLKSTECFIDSAGTCDQFVVEIGPSKSLPYLTTIDVPVNAPELDAGQNLEVLLLNKEAFSSAKVTLPVNPMMTFEVPISTVPSGVVTIASVKDGIQACEPPDSGIVCHLTATAVTPASGVLSFPVLPGRYALTVNPPLPQGASTIVIDVLDAGELEKVEVPEGEGSVTDGGVTLTPLGAIQVSGTVLEPGAAGGSGPLLPNGEVEMLTISDLAPVAIGPVINGAFSLLAPAGQYELIIQPDSTTRFPTYHTIIDADDSLGQLPPITLSVPTLLTGIVQFEDDAGLPSPAQASLQFFYVTSDSDGGALSFPVANAVTDSQGHWSAAGLPPAQ